MDIKFTVSNNVTQLIKQENPNVSNIRVFRLGNTFKISQPGRLEAAIHWLACKLRIEKEITQVSQFDTEERGIIQEPFRKACQTIIAKSQNGKIVGICQKLLYLGIPKAVPLSRTPGEIPVSNISGAPSPDMQSLLESPNGQLAAKIIAASGGGQEVTTICSGGFLVDPTAHLVRKMIERGAGMAMKGDGARAFVISQIPGFINNVGTAVYLREFAKDYFKDAPNKSEIMAIFEKSLASPAFQRDLQAAVDKFKEKGEHSDYYAEGSLRIPLTIYKQSAALKEYSYPQEACLESARMYTEGDSKIGF